MTGVLSYAAIHAAPTIMYVAPGSSADTFASVATAVVVAPDAGIAGIANVALATYSHPAADGAAGADHHVDVALGGLL